MINSLLKKLQKQRKKVKGKLVEAVKLGGKKYHELLIYFNPNSLLIKEKLAKFYIVGYKYNQAITCYYDILKQKPEQASIYIKLAHIFLKQNNLLDARSKFKSVQENSYQQWHLDVNKLQLLLEKIL